MCNKYLNKSPLLILLLIISLNLSGQTETANYNRVLRTAIHVFQDSSGGGNFSVDSVAHTEFLQSIINRVNFQFANLDSMKPAFTSPYIKDIGVELFLDTIYYIRDNYAWNSDSILQSKYMDSVHIINNSSMNYIQKYKTLHIFLAGNYNIVGGHVGDIGDKRFIATRAYYHVYKNRKKEIALSLCWRNLIHETGHTLGLKHNFSGGPSGDQCDDCDDNGCPQEGSSNNIMDYWPGYGFSLSQCQKEIINRFLLGYKGNISHIVINDSCYRADNETDTIRSGESEIWSGLKYVHANILVKDGASLLINGTVSFPEDCSLIIEAGAQVVIDGGRLTNLCGDLWNGIVLPGNPLLSQEPSAGQPLLQLKNETIIENAGTGILVGSDSSETGKLLLKTGGIIEAEDCIFRNNVISVKFLPYDRPNRSFFKSCRFEITRSLNHFEEGFRPEAIVHLYGIRGLEFTENTFYNSIDDEVRFFDRGIGIFSMDASYTVNNNIFNGLYYGIRAVSGNRIFSQKITANIFINNYRGLYLSGINYSNISDNYFELRRSERTVIYGIYIDNCSDFIVEDNEILSVFGGGRIAGVVINGPGRTDDLLYNNDIQNLPLAVLLQGGEKTPALRQTSLDSNDIDILIYTGSGEGMGFANIKYTPYEESYSRMLKGAYNTFYRSDHIPVFYEIGVTDDETEYDVTANMFFSDPLPQIIDLPYPNTSDYSYSFLNNIITELNHQIDSLTFQLEKLKDRPDYISDDKLIADINDPMIPPVLLLRKIINNPRSTGIQEIKNSLEDRFGNLPAYMLKNIEKVSTVKSRHELIKDKIQVREILKHQYLLRALQNVVFDSTQIISDSFDDYIELDNNYTGNVNRVFRHLYNKEYDRAAVVIEMIDAQHGVNDEHFDLMNEYIRYLDFIYSIENDQRTYFGLSEDEISLLENIKVSRFREIACLGANILNFANNNIQAEELFFPE